MNTMKTVVLMVVLTVLVVFAASALGGKNGAVTALAFATIMNFGMYWFSDKIILYMYGARPADSPELYRIVRDLAMKANLPMPKIYVMDNPAPNAFATGRNPNHAAVAVTTGLLNILNTDELSAVLGHELAHIKHRDILIGTIAATMAGAISMLADMAHWAMIFGGRERDGDEGESPIASIAMIIVAPLAAMLIQMAISRSREYIADEGGARIQGNPLSLANALKKLHSVSQQIPMDAKPATSHMFIVNPLSGRGILAIFSTHPAIEERVKRLEGMVVGMR